MIETVSGYQRSQEARPDLLSAARKVESHFLSAMLKNAGLDGSSGAFSGGIGEEQFASFLRDAQAKIIVEGGGIGLAQTVYEAVLRSEGGKP